MSRVERTMNNRAGSRVVARFPTVARDGTGEPAECEAAKPRGGEGSSLHDRLDLGTVQVMVAQRRQRDLGLPRLAITQDQVASGGHALGQHVTAQARGGQRRKPRVQRCEDGFVGGGLDVDSNADQTSGKQVGV